jgi:hypothetical protein
MPAGRIRSAVDRSSAWPALTRPRRVLRLGPRAGIWISPRPSVGAHRFRSPGVFANVKRHVSWGFGLLYPEKRDRRDAATASGQGSRL